MHIYIHCNAFPLFFYVNIDISGHLYFNTISQEFVTVLCFGELVGNANEYVRSYLLSVCFHMTCTHPSNGNV